MSESEINELIAALDYPFGIYVNHETRLRVKFLLKKLVLEHRKQRLELALLENKECLDGTIK